MTQTQAELKRLAKAHPVPSDVKFERCLKRLTRLRDFYLDKYPQAPAAQSILFRQFANSLFYTITTIKMYRALTKKLAALAEEDDTLVH